MESEATAAFCRNQNENGTYNTMCTDCCRTVGWMLDDPDLTNAETTHMCPEKALRKLMAANRPQL
jgi:hypothetical protein